MERRRRAREHGRDRRIEVRARLGSLLLNKYIDGTPHLATLINLSSSGMLVQKLLEPETDRDFYAIELGIPWRTQDQQDERLWLWTHRVRDLGDVQALRFVGLGAKEREAIEEMVREAKRVA